MNTHKLSVFALAFSAGILAALAAFLWTVTVLYMPEMGGSFLRLFEGMFGFTVSWPGAFLLAIFAFIKGLVLGALFALLYNLFASAK